MAEKKHVQRTLRVPPDVNKLVVKTAKKHSLSANHIFVKGAKFYAEQLEA